MNKRISIILIIILSVLAILLTGSMVFLINNGGNFNFSFNFFNNNLKLQSDYKNESSLVSALNIELISTDIEINETDGEDIKIEFLTNNDKTKVNYELKDTVLNIIEEDDSNCLGFCKSKLIIMVPSNYVGNYSIKLVSGDIKSHVSMNEVNIKSVSGDINFNSVSNLVFETTSGDVVIESLEGYVDGRTISGDISINEFNCLEDSKLNTTSGDIKINNNINSVYVDFKTTSGDSKINKSDRKSEHVLDVRTTSGDIRVD